MPNTGIMGLLVAIALMILTEAGKIATPVDLWQDILNRYTAIIKVMSSICFIFKFYTFGLRPKEMLNNKRILMFLALFL